MQVAEAVSTFIWMILCEQRLLVQCSYACFRKVANTPAQLSTFLQEVDLALRSEVQGQDKRDIL